MLDLVTKTARDALVLMITHDPEDARRFAPQTLVVTQGSVMPPRDTVILLADPPPELAQYLGKADPTDSL